MARTNGRIELTIRGTVGEKGRWSEEGLLLVSKMNLRVTEVNRNIFLNLVWHHFAYFFAIFGDILNFETFRFLTTKFSTTIKFLDFFPIF